MIKKLKLLSVIFSTIVLFPLNVSAVSCSGKKVSADGSIVNVPQEKDETETSINEEIKDFIKKSLYDGENASMLSLEQIQENMDVQTKKDLTENLEMLSNELNSSDLTIKELSNEKIIEGLTKRIIDNCNYVNIKLKEPDGKFASEFQGVTGKFLEVDENSVSFNLKKFNLRDILYGATKDDESNSEYEVEDKMGKRINIFADSTKLKIYKFSTNLKLFLKYSNEKEHSFSIQDYNLFIVLDKDKATFLTRGINEYLNKKIIKNHQEDGTIPIYLNNEPDEPINNYFSKIIKQRNYNISDETNKKDIGHYLAKIYLPELIYKNNDHEINVVTPPYVRINEEDRNIDEVLRIQPNVQEQINFLKLFGNKGQPQITEQMVDNNLKIQNFLVKDSNLYSYKRNKYYLLGKGNVDVNRWNIKGFSLNSISLKFKILIKDIILEQLINEMKICFKQLILEMEDSKIEQRNIIPGYESYRQENKGYTMSIAIPKSYKNTYNEAFPKTKGENKEFENILNDFFIAKTKQKLQNFDFKFSVKANINKTNKQEDTLNFSEYNQSYYSERKKNFLDKPINIYFVFDVFKINLTYDSLLKSRKLKTTVNGKTEDSNKIYFVE